MAYVIVAIVAAAAGAIGYWLLTHKTATTGAPTGDAARVAVANAGAAAEAKAEVQAEHMLSAPRPVIDARVQELIAKGKAP